MAIADPVGVIQATLAPIFLVSGATLFLSFIQARLFRAVDRLRSIRRIMRGIPEDAEGMAPLARLQDILLTRALILRNAIIFGVGTLVATVATAVLLILPAIIGVRVNPAFTTTIFAVGLIGFMASLVLGMQDTLVSVRTVKDEIEADPYVES